MARTADELRDAVVEQRSALRSSCAAFDGGHRWEARRIATTLVNLFHTKGRTTALLEQAGILGGLRLLSTASPNPPGNLLTWSPLIMMQMGPMGASYAPVLDAPFIEKRHTPFQEWWDETVYEDGDYNLTRSILLRTLRDQDGGSHYDADVSDQAYKLLKRGAGWVAQTEDGEEHAIGDAELASTRQIAFEVEETLERTLGPNSH